MTLVVLPFDEGVLCSCGALWNTYEVAARCPHTPGAGRTLPLAGDRWRRMRIRYGDMLTSAGMVLAWFIGVVLFLYVIPKWVA